MTAVPSPASPRRLAHLGLALLLGLGCNQTTLVHAPAPLETTEVFPQESASKIDLLWVIDDSNYMSTFQANLAASFQNFINVFSAGDIDYRIAVTTQDMITQTPGSQGTLYGNPQIISSADDDPLSEFQQNVQVGANGDDYHEGLDAAQTVLSTFVTQNAPILAARTACEAGCGILAPCIATCDANNEPTFLRPDAYLAVIFITIHEDQSEGDPVYYSRWFETLKGLGNAEEVQVSAICGNVANPPCANTVEGTKYMQVASITNGIVGDICDPTFDQDLTNLANVTVSLKRHFLLGGTPKASSIAVTIAYRCDTPHDDPSLASCTSINDTCTSTSAASELGILCTPEEATAAADGGIDGGATVDGYTEGWAYQCSDNSIYFFPGPTGDSVPGIRSQISVTYLPASGTAGCSE